VEERSQGSRKGSQRGSQGRNGDGKKGVEKGRTKMDSSSFNQRVKRHGSSRKENNVFLNKLSGGKLGRVSAAN
jgi:hypothetical protein